jgi:hypothetical protein
VLAAFLVPAPRSGWTSQGAAPATPPGLVVVLVGLPALLATPAATGIVTTTRRRLPGPIWLLPAISGIGTVTLAAVWLYTAWPDDMVNGSSRTLVEILCLAPALTLAWLTYALINGAPRRAATLAGTALGLGIVGLPLTVMTVLAAMFFAGQIRAPMGYGQTYDGTPYLPATLVIGVLLAIVAVHGMRRPTTALVVEPATVL